MPSALQNKTTLSTNAIAALHSMSSEAWYMSVEHLNTFANIAMGLSTAGDAEAIDSPFDFDLSSLGVKAEGYSARTVIAGATAVIPVTGMLRPKNDFWVKYGLATSTKNIVSDTHQAMKDERIENIVYAVDSPGGLSMGNAEAAKVIYGYRGKKPMTTFAEGLMASAAYYIGSATGNIIATPSSSIGSIGTILTHMEVTEALSQMGYKVTEIHHGENKGLGSPYRKLNATAKKHLQGYVDSYGSQFVGAVMKHRGVSQNVVDTRFGQGRTFIASEAMERGLIDAIGSLDSNGQIVIEEQRKSRSVAARSSVAVVQPTSESENSVPFSTKVIAAMYLVGVIESQDADESIIESSFKGFCKGKKQTSADR